MLEKWEVAWLDSDGLELWLYFNDAIQVSQEDNPDLLFIQIELNEFTDKNGNSLPESLVKYIEIPRQIASVEEVELVEDTADAFGDASTGVLTSNLAV